VIRNAEFAREIRNVWVPGGSTAVGKFYRGRLETSPATSSDDVVWQLQFLYNPTDVNFTASVNANAAAADPSSTPFTNGANTGNPIGTASFALLFDRTFECNDPSSALHDWGVQADIALLYSMLGMDENQIIAEGLGSKTGNQSSLLDPLSRDNAWMPSAPMGGSRALLTAIFGHRLTFFGRIDSIAIDYTHFTQQMVPVRCALSVSMTVWPPLAGAALSPQVQAAQKQQAATATAAANAKLKAAVSNRHALAKAQQADKATAGPSGFTLGNAAAYGMWGLTP
jgi:hypothetical protein